MGQEILYCFKCQERVTSADLDSANALRFGNRTACKKCVPDLLASLSSQERKDLVSRVQSPKKASTGRFQAAPTPRAAMYPVAAGRSNQVFLWVIGGVVVALIIGIVMLMGGSRPPPAPRETSTVPAPRAPEENPRDRAAREAIAKAKSLSSSDPEAQLEGFERAVRLSEGTPREREAKELRDEFVVLRRKTLVKEMAAVEERARVVQQKEEFGAALAIYEAVRALHPGPEWKSLVDAKVDEVRKAIDSAYLPLMDQAAAARAKGAEDEVKSIRDRVGRWGLAEKIADLDARLKNVQPPPRPGLAPWVPIFEGKSLDFLAMGGEGAWSVENGALAHVKGKKASAQTKRQFNDGDFRIRFKVRQSSHVGFAVRQAVEGYYFVALNGAELNQLDDKEHEVVIFCRGGDVKATLDDKPIPVEARGKPTTKGPLQFNSYGEYFVIKALEFRELPENDGLVGHWKFDGTTDAMALDASGRGNHGNHMDGPSSAPGKIGAALQLDGRKSHVAVPSSPSLAITGPMTITAWVNSGAPREPITAPAIVEKWDPLTGANLTGYFLRLSTKGAAHFMISEPGKYSEVTSLKPVPIETWTFLAAVFDGASVHLYVNGTLERTVPATASPGASTGPLRIGMGGGGGSHYFIGLIDEVRVYSRALSADEVARLAAR